MRQWAVVVPGCLEAADDRGAAACRGLDEPVVLAARASSAVRRGRRVRPGASIPISLRCLATPIAAGAARSGMAPAKIVADLLPGGAWPHRRARP
jgi:hypothetical protein